MQMVMFYCVGKVIFYCSAVAGKCNEVIKHLYHAYKGNTWYKIVQKNFPLRQVPTWRSTALGTGTQPLIAMEEKDHFHTE